MAALLATVAWNWPGARPGLIIASDKTEYGPAAPEAPSNRNEDTTSVVSAEKSITTRPLENVMLLISGAGPPPEEVTTCNTEGETVVAELVPGGETTRQCPSQRST